MQQEIIYLSDAKLGQFISNPRPRLPALKANISTPVGGVNLETPGVDEPRKTTQQLRRVERQLAKAARPFTASDLRPGQWVEFTVALRWVALKGQYRDLVLFVDPAADTWPQPELPLGRRLLLHGSTRHLRGHPAVPVDGPELRELAGWASAGTMVVTKAGQLVQALADAEAQGAASVCLPTGSDVRDLLQALDASRGEVDTAALVTGYARVSGLLPATDTTHGCLIASPLIVRYPQ
jgi:hypothetical protein